VREALLERGDAVRRAELQVEVVERRLELGDSGQPLGDSGERHPFELGRRRVCVHTAITAAHNPVR
jgi:hypothetical protein